MKKIFKKINVDYLFFWLIFLAVMIVYLFTLCPTIYLEDAGELVTAAAALGIPHPSGYPLWVLLGKLFTFIPLGSVAWRVNLMSAVFGALTASFLYLIIYHLTKKRIISFLSSLALPFSSIFWSQSVISEVYTLNSFFVALLIYLILKWSESRKNSILLWFSLLYGLSITNHQMMLLIIPAFALFVYLNDRNIFRKYALLLKALFLFVLGLTVYLYLPLRSMQNPILDWGNPETLSSFWAHISRQAYGDFSFVDQGRSKLVFVLTFFMEIIYDFFLPTFIFSILGLFYLLVKKFKVGLMLFLIFIFNSLGIILLRNVGWGFGNHFIYRVYYLPCFLIVVIFFGLSMAFCYDKLLKFFAERKSLISILKIFFLAVLAILPISLIIANYNDNDRSDFWLAYDYGKNLLGRLEPNAMLLIYGDSSIANDSELFSIMYLQKVEKFRTDVMIITDGNLFGEKVNITMPVGFSHLIFMKKREGVLDFVWKTASEFSLPLYTNFVVHSDTLRDLNLVSRSDGIVHKVYEDLNAAKTTRDWFEPVGLRNIDNKGMTYSKTTILSRFFYNQAIYFMEIGHEELAREYLLKAIELDDAPMSGDYKNYIKHRKEWNNSEGEI